jgi:hypothetical protein
LRAFDPQEDPQNFIEKKQELKVGVHLPDQFAGFEECCTQF